MAEYSDPISRSLRRCGGIAGSPLEKLVRANAYKLISGSDADDAKLDSFIATAREDEYYAASFVAPPAGAAVTSKATITPSEKERAAMAASGKAPSRATAKPKDWQQTDIVRLAPDEFESIASGKKSFVGK